MFRRLTQAEAVLCDLVPHHVAAALLSSQAASQRQKQQHMLLWPARQQQRGSGDGSGLVRGSSGSYAAALAPSPQRSPRLSAGADPGEGGEGGQGGGK
jgi:hypothetical protein